MSLKNLIHSIASMFGSLFNLLLPRCCPVCGRRLQAGEILTCSGCAIQFNMEGVFDDSDDNVMVKLLFGQFDVQRANALFHFEPHEGLANMIYEMKYRQRPDIGVAIGRRMALELGPKGFFDGIDMIIPIPLTRSRQRQRGYNQAEMLADGINEITGIPVNTTVVARKKFSGSQTRLGRWERKSNVEKLFELKDGDAIKDKHVLIIDDVFTTGATVTECGKTLSDNSGNNVKISVLTACLAKR